jgi:sodium-coupled neutral amino acid transporter 11
MWDFNGTRVVVLTICSAFGGMLAFCVIVGDTIPQVMDHLFPALEDLPFLWLLTNRRAVMILLILGISYPPSPMQQLQLTPDSSPKPVVSPLSA